MKYFYTDPLAAAWMAKHHNMRFMDSEDREIFWNREFQVFDCPGSPKDWPRIKYIHSDSLHLLVADNLPEGTKVIQRNGIVFMPPESEE